MKERGIPFTEESILGILAGKKTQTRRLVFPGPDPGRGLLHSFVEGLATFGDSIPDDPVPLTKRCPYEPGDRLWVRETWAPADHLVIGTTDCDPPHWVWYRAGDVVLNQDGAVADRYAWPPRPKRWHSPRFMHRVCARLWLEVTEVRVEPLQAITEEDARAEGVPVGVPVHGCLVRDGKAEPATVHFFNARDSFAHLWSAINGKRAPWKKNPWVWVVGFRRIEGHGQAS